MQNVDEMVTAAESWSYIAVRFTTFTALVVLIGSVIFASWIVPRLAQGGAAGAGGAIGAMRGRVRVLALGASIALVALAASRVALQRSVLTQELGSEVPLALGDVMAGSWGMGVLVQVVGGVAGILAFGVSLPSALSAVARGVALASAASPALSGHAAGEEAPLLPIIADTGHVLAAGGWAGMLAALVLVGLPALRGDGRNGGGAIRALLAAFSPVALTSAALLTISGAYGAWIHLGALDALWTTRYGEALFRKLVLVVVMIALGAINWRRLGPAASATSGEGRLARSSWLELLVALAILFASAVLVARGTPADTVG